VFVSQASSHLAKHGIYSKVAEASVPSAAKATTGAGTSCSPAPHG
jgi:hypothetical protein